MDKKEKYSATELNNIDRKILDKYTKISEETKFINNLSLEENKEKK